MKLILKGNPLRCNCLNFHLLQFIKEQLTPEVYYWINIRRADELVCSGPDSLAGLHIKELPNKALSCPLISPLCPEKCSCAFRASDRGLIINCRERLLSATPNNLLRNISAFYVDGVIASTIYKEKRNPFYLTANHTELDLSGNGIISLPKNFYEELIKVTILNLSSNNLTYIDVAGLPLNLNVSIIYMIT